MDFFSMARRQRREDQNSVKEIPLPDIPEYTPEELMPMEKATTGLYLSGHPMDHYRDAVRKLGAPTIGSILEDFAQEGGPAALHRRPADHHLPASSPPARRRPPRTTPLWPMSRWRTTPPPWNCCASARVLETCGAYLKENQAVVVKGRLSVRDEKAPQIMCDSIYPLSTVEGGIPEPQPKRETAAGETLFLKFPSIDDSCHPPHEAGVPDVPRQKRGENGHGGHPKGLCYPSVAAPGIGAGSSGDAGSRKCGRQITAKDPKSPAFGIFRRPGLVYLFGCQRKNRPSENGEPVKSCQRSSRKKLRPREAGG